MNALPTLPEFESDSADTTNVGLKWQKWVLMFENFTVAYDKFSVHSNNENNSCVAYNCSWRY